MQPINSLYDFFEAFPDEQSAIDHLRSIRWKDGAYCPYCKSKRVMHFSDKRTHKCADCRQRFSIKVGTIFEDTKIPLRKWFAAIWMITSHKKGTASTTLARDLKITQKSAWFVLHRLRHAARAKSFNRDRPLSGEVEIDESYFGGSVRNRATEARKAKAPDKVVAFGMLERGGEVRVRSAPDLKGWRVRGRVIDNVAPGTIILSDEAASAQPLRSDFPVMTINHSRGQYADGMVHINGIEGVWSLFKRQVYGIHHWISAKHFDNYMGEMCYRYSRREMEECYRINDLLGCVSGLRLTYKALIGAPRSSDQVRVETEA